MKNPLRSKSWSPYAVGIGIGALSWFAFFTADHPLGITTAFEHTAALVVRFVVPQWAAANEYYHQESPKISWEWMLVIGVFLGALSSSLLSGDREKIVVPPLWKWRFGDSVALRLAAAFAGGALMMFGARLARGCTSGHGISGGLQLAASSWLFSIIFFAVAVLTAFGLYAKKGVDHV